MGMEYSTPSRDMYKRQLVHYEGIFWNREYPATSDMDSQMYTPVADMSLTPFFFSWVLYRALS